MGFWEFILRIVRRLLGCPTGRLTVSPPMGPTGTNVTFTVVGTHKLQGITLWIPPASVPGVTDAQGDFTYTLPVFNQEPRRIPITAVCGQGLCKDTMRASCTVT